LYLWQTFFLHFQSAQVFGGETIFNTFPGNWLAILIVASCSYYFIEQPALRLRVRLMNRRRTAAVPISALQAAPKLEN
jgi:peptidoglycan/LPS O-acetylase OafA/YrhL